MQHLSYLLLVLQTTIFILVRSDEPEFENTCPLNMDVLNRNFLRTSKIRALEDAKRLEEVLEQFREENREQANRVGAMLQKVEEGVATVDSRLTRLELNTDLQLSKLAKEVEITLAKTNEKIAKTERNLPAMKVAVETISQKVGAQFIKLEQNEGRRDAQMNDFAAQLTKTHADILQQVHTLAGLGERMEKSERTRDAQISSVETKFKNMSAPVMKKLDAQFTEVAHKFAALELNHKSFGDDLVHQVELAVGVVQNLRRSLREEMFKCGKALKLDLRIISTGTYYFSPSISSWNVSKEFCELNEMRLAKIEDAHELQEVDLAAPNHNAWYWVGGWDGGRQTGHFSWVDGGESVNETFWDRGQPSSFGPAYDTCVFLYTENAKLGDYACSNKEFFICELGPECYQAN